MRWFGLEVCISPNIDTSGKHFIDCGYLWEELRIQGYKDILLPSIQIHGIWFSTRSNFLGLLFQFLMYWKIRSVTEKLTNILPYSFFIPYRQKLVITNKYSGPTYISVQQCECLTLEQLKTKVGPCKFVSPQWSNEQLLKA
jgi:hypothetical protein